MISVALFALSASAQSEKEVTLGAAGRHAPEMHPDPFREALRILALDLLRPVGGGII